MRRAAGRWPDWEGRPFRITGSVQFGDDVRDRGSDGNAPLLVEGTSQAVWDEFRRKWEAGGMTDGEIEDAVADLCEDSDIGYAPDGFPGTSYTVTM